jgi:hypothetical protein
MFLPFAFFLRHAPDPGGLAGRRQHGIQAQSALYRFAQSAIPCRPIFFQVARGIAGCVSFPPPFVSDLKKYLCMK